MMSLQMYRCIGTLDWIGVQVVMVTEKLPQINRLVDYLCPET